MKLQNKSLKKNRKQLVNIMSHYGLILCITPYMSAVGVGGVIKCCLYLGEAIIFGSFAYLINISDISHL